MTFPSPVECRLVLPLPGTRLARTAPIPTEARRVLHDGAELPVSRTLYLNARREELLENYRLAVVEAETAFETLVDQTVAGYYKEQGLSDAEVEKKLRTAFMNLIRDHIPRCCGEPFEGTREHAAWHSDLYELRNSVVHDGASVDAGQAGSALDAAEKAIGWIEGRTPTVFPVQ